MSEMISAKEKKFLDAIIKELHSYSLLQPQESVVGGFYPLKVNDNKQYIYYGLLTQTQLILTQKIQYSKPNKSELVPFKNIKEITFSHERNKYLLLRELMALILLPIVWGVMHFMFGSLFPFDPFYIILIDITCWVLIVLLIVTAPMAFYRYNKGENVIHLSIPKEQLKLQHREKFPFRLKDIILFKTLEGDDVFKDVIQFKPFTANLNYQGTKGNIEDLYNLLMKYGKGEIIKFNGNF